MSDLILSFVLFTLVLVVVIQGIERYFFAEQAQKEKDRLLEELSKAIKAVISKNANDYVMTTSIDKVPEERSAPISPDLVPEETLSDEEFFGSIDKQLKQ